MLTPSMSEAKGVMERWRDKEREEKEGLEGL